MCSQPGFGHQGVLCCASRYLGCGRVQVVQVGAAHAAVQRCHGGLEGVVVHLGVAALRRLLLRQLRPAGVDLRRTAGVKASKMGVLATNVQMIHTTLKLHFLGGGILNLTQVGNEIRLA